MRREVRDDADPGRLLLALRDGTHRLDRGGASIDGRQEVSDDFSSRFLSCPNHFLVKSTVLPREARASIVYLPCLVAVDVCNRGAVLRA